MKLIARLMGFTIIGVLFMGMFMELMQLNVRYNELNQITSTAINQTQIVMREQIEDKFFNYENARITFHSNEEYTGYFEECLKKLIASDSKYKYTVYYADYEKGLISVGVDCSYIKLNGETKTLHTRKTSIVDILMDADTGELIPDANVSILAEPAAVASFEYDGTSHHLLTGGSVSGGRLLYGYSSSATVGPSEYTTAIPKVKNAGNYFVWYKIENIVSHAIYCENCVGSVVVSKRPLSVTWGADNWIYDGSEHVALVTLDNIVSTDICTVSMTNNKITNVGTQVAKISSVNNANYKVADSLKEHTIAVTKANANVYADSIEIGYGVDIPFTYTHDLFGSDELVGTPVYTVKDSSETPYTMPIPMGEYRIILSGLSNPNYNLTFNEGILKVTADKDYIQFAPTDKTISTTTRSLTIESATNTYGTTTYELQYAMDASSYNDVTKFSLSGTTLSIASGLRPGTYILSVKVSCTGDSNHVAAEIEKIFNVTVEGTLTEYTNTIHEGPHSYPTTVSKSFTVPDNVIITKIVLNAHSHNHDLSDLTCYCQANIYVNGVNVANGDLTKTEHHSGPADIYSSVTYEYPDGLEGGTVITVYNNANGHGTGFVKELEFTLYGMQY